MAMINCPECGQEISDKSKKCVHCGKVLVEEENENPGEVIICSECGATLSETDKVCPKCGCPVESCESIIEVKPEEIQVPDVKPKKNGKKIIIGVIIALIICIIGGVGYKVYSDKKAEEARIEAKEKAERERKEAYNTYIDNVNKVQSLMTEGGKDSEDICNLTSRVWYNAIYEESDSETDAYTQPDGYFVDDFNTALGNLFDDAKVSATIYNIQNNQSDVKAIMKKLQNPPEGLSKCYETVSELHHAYTTLTNLAVNPSGNYNTFSTNKDNAISDFVTIATKLDTQIPKKK